MNQEIELRRIVNVGDLERFNTLFKKCFKMDRGAQYFQWKYFDNPSGDFIGYEAIHKGKTVASYGMVPEDYYINGERVKLYQAADAMVSPRYWGKNLFVQIARKTQEFIFANEPRTFMNGWPGHLSYPQLINDLGWVDAKKNCKHIFTTKFLTHSKCLFLQKSGYTVDKIDAMTPELALFLDSQTVNTHSSFRLFDSERYNWKVFQRPDWEYKTITLKKKNQIVAIGTYRKDTAKSCELSWFHINKLTNPRYLSLLTKEIFKNENVRYISTWKPLKSENFNLMRELGFVENKINYGPFNTSFPYIVRKRTDTLTYPDDNVFQNIDHFPLNVD